MKYDKYLDVISNKASVYKVKPDIHDEDFIFEFLMENKSFSCKEDAINYYFMDGEISAKKLLVYINDVCKFDNGKIKLLEFASGYGCVTRHFKNVLENVSITSCDIHEEAVNFIESILNMPAIISNATPELFKTDDKYNVVFALSFFSHMPKSTWGRWLNALASNAADGGYIIFTTHGQESMKFFGKPKLDSEGFWFKNESEQKDLNSSEYGQAIVSHDYVCNVIKKYSNMELVRFDESEWWGHQDLYIVRIKNDSVS